MFPNPLRGFTTSSVKDALTAAGKGPDLNHIAVAVPRLEDAARFYRDTLGAQVSEPVPLMEHGVRIVFVNLNNTKIELLEPLGSESPITKFLQKRPSGGIHHICLDVEDLDASMDKLRNKNVRLLSEKPKIGAHGKPVVFLNPGDAFGSLVELQQR